MTAQAKSFSTAHRIIVWLAALSVIGLLGLVRASTDAEFAFASAAILPVMLVAWANGFAHGAAASCLAAAMWVAADLRAGREFSAGWIPLLNGTTRLLTYFLVAYLTARVRALLARESELATHDALTGLLNRRAFLDAGEAETRRAQRYGHSLAVVFLDLDNFKQLNDARGHAAGDAALKAVAAALKNSLRASDEVARLGGDEFAILLPEIGEKATADAGRKLDDAVAASLGPYSPVSASIGIAWFDGAHEDFTAMLKAADALMYEIKQQGKRAVRVRTFHDRATDASPQ